MTRPRYHRFSDHLRETLGGRVLKVPIDTGATCPNRDGTRGRGGCLYCDAFGSGPGRAARALPVSAQIDRWIGRSRAPSSAGYLAYFQAFTPTYTAPDTLRALLAEAWAHERIVGLSVGARPDCLSEPILDVLQEAARAGYFWLEVGLQSANPETLALINRGHTVEAFRDAVTRARSRGIPVCSHVILGLPGEGDDDLRATAALVADLGVEGVKIHPLHVLRGTRLLDMFQQGRVAIQTLSVYANRVVDFLERIPPAVVVQRLTGERSPDILVAPLWCLDKHRVLRAIMEVFDARDSHQGEVWAAVDGVVPHGAGR